jgi:tRNA-dihydrouridine synthase
MYRSQVHYDVIASAVRFLRCPVLANGNIESPVRAAEMLGATGAKGLMIGRGCIRNPWLFDQIRAHQRQATVALPTGRDVLAYIEELWEATERPESKERLQVERMKRYLNFIGQAVGSSRETAVDFLHRIRRTTNRCEFFGICRTFLNHRESMDLRPFPDVAASRNEVALAT